MYPSLIIAVLDTYFVISKILKPGIYRTHPILDFGQIHSLGICIVSN